jgi:ABC-type oligopeptide transport system substrate-binding subunit
MKRITLAFALVVSLLALAGCKDPYGACEKASANVAQSLTGGFNTVNQLQQTGTISVQEAANVFNYLKFANDANAAFSTCAQQAHNAGGKAGAYTACATTFTAALNTPAELALIHVSNANSQQTVQTIVTAVSTGVTALVTALGGQ